jgi:hypothetical protein
VCVCVRNITSNAGSNDEDMGFATRDVEDCWIWAIDLERHFMLFCVSMDVRVGER